jgi:hypothetical protein
MAQAMWRQRNAGIPADRANGFRYLIPSERSAIQRTDIFAFAYSLQFIDDGQQIWSDRRYLPPALFCFQDLQEALFTMDIQPAQTA